MTEYVHRRVFAEEMDESVEIPEDAIGITVKTESPGILSGYYWVDYLVPVESQRQRRDENA